VAGDKLYPAGSGEHVDRIVCEFSQGDAGRRGGRGAVAAEQTTLEDKFGLGQVGGRPINGGNSAVDALDRGLRGRPRIVGQESRQPAKGVSQQLGLGQLVRTGVFDGVGGVSLVDGD